MFAKTNHRGRDRAAVVGRITRVLVFFAVTILTACETVSPAHRAGIAGELVVNVPGEAGFTRVEVVNLQSDITKAIGKPSKTLLFMFNHGTSSGQIWQTCKPRSRPAVTTQFITNGQELVGAEVNSFEYAIYYLCSTVAGSQDLIRQRSSEIIEAVDVFRAAGIPSKHIFLVGHSGGASSALVAAARAPEKVNAVIASAPGYGYAHLGARGDAYIEIQDIKERWQADTSVNGHLNAMVLAYADDRFAPPADMAFLKELDGIEFVHVPEGKSRCNGSAPHAFFSSTCILQRDAELLGYIRQRLLAAQPGS